jgi:hypothetical protein
VLVVVEDRDLHACAKFAFHLEAVGSLDVFQVDAAEGGFERGHHFDQPVDIGFGDFDVEHIDACEFLEQDRLALHDRLGGKRTNVAQPQHGGAIGDDRHQVAAAGVA